MEPLIRKYWNSHFQHRLPEGVLAGNLILFPIQKRDVTCGCGHPHATLCRLQLRQCTILEPPWDAIDYWRCRNFGNIPWQSFLAKHSGEAPPTSLPDWMLKEYTVHFCDSFLSFEVWLQITNLKTSLTMCLTKNLKTECVVGQMLCLGTGHGSKQFICLFLAILVDSLLMPTGYHWQRLQYPSINDGSVAPG